jgi:hypothetical protein
MMVKDTIKESREENVNKGINKQKQWKRWERVYTYEKQGYQGVE